MYTFPKSLFIIIPFQFQFPSLPGMVFVFPHAARRPMSRPRSGVFRLRPPGLVIIITIVVINLAFSQDVKRSSVCIDSAHRFAAVNVADEALRRRDPFENRFRRCSSAMATDCEHPFLAVRVTDP